MLYPEKLRQTFWRVALWAGVALAALAPRLAVMAFSETHLDADESIVGLMAMHAARDGRLPAFFWGQHYGGGHVIEAALSAILFKLGGGPSAAFVQIVPVAFACGLIVLAFAWVREIYGTRTAVWAALALSFSTPLLKSSLKADGYVETMFLCFLGLYLLHRLRGAVDARRGLAAFVFSAAMGAVFGLAWWSYDFALVFALVAAIVAVRRKLVRGMTHIFILLLGFLLGASPIIYDNLTHDFANVSHLASNIVPGRPWYEHLVFSAVRLFTVQLPAFLTRECVHNFVFPPPWEAWLYLGLLLLGIFVIAQQRVKSRMPGVWALAPALYLLFYCATSLSGALDADAPWNFTRSVWTLGRAPRYLLPIEPFVTLMAVAGIGILLKSKRPPTRYLGIMAAPTLAFVLALGFANILNDNSIYEGNIKTDPQSISQVIAHLKDNGVDCVHTTYFIKWRILFESSEQVSAMDIDILRGGKQGYDFYEQNACGGNKPLSFVLHRSSPLALSIHTTIQNGIIPYRPPVLIGDHVVFLPENLKDMDKQLEEQEQERDAVNKILHDNLVGDPAGELGAMPDDQAGAIQQEMELKVEQRLDELSAPEAAQSERALIIQELDEKFPEKRAPEPAPGAATKTVDILP